MLVDISLKRVVEHTSYLLIAFSGRVWLEIKVTPARLIRTPLLPQPVSSSTMHALKQQILEVRASDVQLKSL